jgi:uncharacterized protein YecT (DUF1311 family)
MLILSLALCMFYLRPTNVIAQERLRVNEAIVIDCVTSNTPSDCIGEASNKCQGLHDDGFDGGSTQGIATCINHEMQIWDQLLHKREKVLSKYYEELDTSSFQQTIMRAESFKQAQASWKNHLEKECRFQYSLNQEGTIRTITFANCKLSMTAKRVLLMRNLVAVE